MNAQTLYLLVATGGLVASGMAQPALPTSGGNLVTKDPGGTVTRMPVQSLAVPEGHVFLKGHTADTMPVHYTFSVPSSNLPSKVVWDPGQHPFPLLLDAEARRAQQFLAQEKHVTNRLAFQSLDISRLPVGDLSPASDGEPQRHPAGEWIVDFCFSVSSGNPLTTEYRWVVMMLDGTYASETSSMKPQRDRRQISRAASAPPVPVVIASATSTNSTVVPQPRKLSAFELVQQADFKVPEIQWSPDRPFPLALDEVVVRAASALREAHGMPQTCVLRYISLYRFIPYAAVAGTGASLSENLEHWLVLCAFAPDVRPEPTHRAYLLLDGRVLCLQGPGG